MDTRKQVVGYPAYEISTEGKIYRAATGAELSIRQAGSGYLRFTVATSGTPRQKTISLHRMVAEAFIPNPENKPFVNHIDGNKRNNKLENLEWCTAKENTQHALLIGLAPSQKGEHNPASRLTYTQVSAIKAMLNIGVSNVLIAHAVGIDPVTVYEIKVGANWANVPARDYKTPIPKSVSLPTTEEGGKP